MRIGVPKETASGERRVALVPEVVRKLSGGGHAVVVEAGAGEAATYWTEGAVAMATPLNVPSSMPEHASQPYARNVLSLLS